MIEVTDAARQQILEILAAQEGDTGIRLSITGRGRHGFEYEITLVQEQDKQEGDVAVEGQGFLLLLDGEHINSLEGAKLDFVQQANGMGFKIDNPNPLWNDALAQRVQQVLDEEINPGVASHGGYVTLLDVKDHRAFIRLGGGCHGCGMADVTLKEGIEVAIRNAVPEIEQVLDTTDHASGTNPYYQPAKGGASPFGH
jgi:Fe/S biogenesis protein NfuA